MIEPAQGAAAPPDVPELIPVRMLNEFTYCPRLAYLEWVQGEFEDNLETEQGRFGHRRVDQPSTKQFEELSLPQTQTPQASGGRGQCRFWHRAVESALAKEDSPDGLAEDVEEAGGDEATAGAELDSPAAAESGETIHARSLMLSAPKEGLIAKVDVIELDGQTATPVDYKRGKAPKLKQGAWEPERVQLCAQGLILREAGYQCDKGVLYFIGSKRRIEIPLDDALVNRTRELIGQLRAAAARPQAPPPLVDSPKCPRCSLVGICLPDEVGALQSGKAAEESQRSGLVRKLLPARDDALPLYVNEQGAYVGKSGERLTIKAQGKTLQEVKLMEVSQVSVFGNVQVTSQALRELAQRGVPVCHFSYGGWLSAMTGALAHKNIDLRMRQFALAAEAAPSLELARRFIVGKIKNCRTLLRRNLPEKKDPCLARLADFAAQAERADSAESLLGTEGMAAKVYFAHFGKLFKRCASFNLEGRNRRPPTDPVNCLLSFLYALLTKDLTVTVQAVGFDPMLGFFHRPRYGRPSLALDLAEEFRPLIGDSTAMMLINNGEVRERDFIHRAGAVALTTAGRKSVLSAYERRMDSLATHPIFGYRVSYRRILEVQARLLARAVLGEIEEYPSFCTR